MKIKGIKILILSVLTFGFYACFGQVNDQISAKEITLYAANYVSPSDSDAIAGVLNLLKDAKTKGANRIVFQKGIYHFYADHAFEKYCFISNHDSGPRKIAFPLLNFKNLEIDGGGSEFIMNGLIIPFAIENSSNVKIRNLSINWYRPTHSELTVVAVDSEKQFVDFSISSQYPYEIRNGELIFIKKGFEHNLENAVYWNPKTHAVAYQSRQITPPLSKALHPSVKNFHDKEDFLYKLDPNDPVYKKRGVENSLFARQLKPGLVRITGVKPIVPEVGWILVCKGANGNNRLSPAMRLWASDDIVLENLNVHHASGMGLIAENCRDVTLNHFNVFPKPNDHRMISTTADATHFVNCRGLIKMENCRFENQFDDATNIHGIYVEITDIKTNIAGVRIGHFQQVGFDFAFPGDSVVAVNPAISELPVARLSVESIEKINPRYYKITFNKPLPNNVQKGFYLENVQACPEVEIRNNRFINNRARGLLISTPRKVLIEGNTFSNMMTAIKCHSGFSFWYESGYVKDLTIRNNTFLDGYYGALNPGSLIEIGAFSANDDFIHGKITVGNNTFSSFASGIVATQFVKDLYFKNNIIKYSGNYPINSSLPVIELKMVGRAEIANNDYDLRFKNFISKESKQGILIDHSNVPDK